jgi:NAD(P)-dependent dehydrogenase (short-subunit alcohol dehydrogenase family)
MRIEGSAALVTGGSRGLGAALGRALARDGARVALVARGAAELEEVAADIRAAGGEAHAVPGDIGDPRAAAALAGTAAALVGPLDLVVHGASTLGPVPLRLLLDTHPTELERALAVNVVGPFRLTRLVAGGMALRGRGLVVHVTSDASVAAYPRWGAYGLSKAAFDHMARTWAAELEGTGVRFLSVDPGEMDTRMHAEAVPEADPATLLDPAVVAERIVQIVRDAETFPSGARVEAGETTLRGSGGAGEPPPLDERARIHSARP